MSNKAKVSQKASMKVALRLPFLVTFLAAAVLVAAFFLPLAVAQGEQLEQIKKYEEMGGDEIVEEYAPEWKELGAEVTGEDGKYISLYEYVKIYIEMSGSDKDSAMMIIAIIGASGIFSLVTLLFALLKKPILVLIFDALTCGAFWVVVNGFKNMGSLPSKYYGIGIAYYLYFISVALVFIGAVWMFAAKRRQKKRIKTESMSAAQE